MRRMIQSEVYDLLKEYYPAGLTQKEIEKILKSNSIRYALKRLIEKKIIKTEVEKVETLSKKRTIVKYKLRG